MIDGFYSVTYGVGEDFGAGVLVLRDGSVLGGDSMMFYRGEYAVSDGSFTARLEIAKHTDLEGHTSVFGIDRASIEVMGEVSDTGDVTGSATTPQAPGLVMAFEMRRLPD